MNLDFVAEVWDALRSHIDLNDRSEAADSLVNLLIDNNYEAEDIKNAFKGEKEVITALKEYIAQHDTEESYEDYDEDDVDEEWD
jgi:homoserine dehydrogenase